MFIDDISAQDVDYINYLNSSKEVEYISPTPEIQAQLYFAHTHTHTHTQTYRYFAMVYDSVS